MAAQWLLGVRVNVRLATAANYVGQQRLAESMRSINEQRLKPTVYPLCWQYCSVSLTKNLSNGRAGPFCIFERVRRCGWLDVALDAVRWRWIELNKVFKNNPLRPRVSVSLPVCDCVCARCRLTGVRVRTNQNQNPFPRNRRCSFARSLAMLHGMPLIIILFVDP